jgi:hypothetical protein
MIGMPWQKQSNPLTALCVGQLFDRRNMSMCMVHGDAFVAHSRNRIVDSFLATDHEYLFFIDDDMLVPFGDADWYLANSGIPMEREFAGLHAIDRLLQSGKKLIGGLYFGRYPKAPPMFGEGMRPDVAAYARQCPKDEIRPTRWVATGCMLIHRSVFEDIEKTFPNLARKHDGYGGQFFSTSEHKLHSDVEALRKFMGTGPMTGEKCVKAYGMVEKMCADAHRNSTLGMGEDVQFCVRALQAGHQPHVDLALVCGHVGSCVYGPHNTRRHDGLLSSRKTA